MPNMGIAKKPAASAARNRKPSSAAVAPATRVVAREAPAAYRVAASAAAPSASAADALFTTTQQRVLGLLFGDPDRSFFANELIALTGSGSGGVQRELARLEQAALVTVQWIGNQKHYQANKASPVFSGLWDIIQKTVGLAGPLKAALQPLAPQIRAAFVYGSMAKKQESAGSDVDVLVVSDQLGYPELFSALEPAAVSLGRTINPTVYTSAEFAKRMKEGKAFVTRVMAQPKIWLIGTEHDLGV